MKSDIKSETIQAEAGPLLQPVRVIDVRGETALVEYRRSGIGLCRGYVPLSAVQDGAAAEETLELAIPYGVPWEELITLSATAAQLAEQLRQAGIWTVADLQANSRAAFGALQAVYGLDLGALCEAAARYQEKEKP